LRQLFAEQARFLPTLPGGAQSQRLDRCAAALRQVFEFAQALSDELLVGFGKRLKLGVVV
jgi:hypothetical protein